MLLTFLKLCAIAFWMVSALHLVFGMGSEAMLGAHLGEATLTDPTLNSQNRFYGVAFALYGVVFWMSAADFARYRPMLLAALWLFFAAGVARLLAFALHGWPTPAVVALGLIELIGTPLLLLWILRFRPTNLARD
ncbi:MAG: DUF4345 domain-containing protein [Pseudomonadales bacterium]